MLCVIRKRDISIQMSIERKKFARLEKKVSSYISPMRLFRLKNKYIMVQSITKKAKKYSNPMIHFAMSICIF